MDRLIKLMETQGLATKQIHVLVAGIKDHYKGYVPKHRFDEVNEAKKQLGVVINERKKQLEVLKQSSGESKSLREQIDKLQADLQSTRAKYEADLDDLRMTEALRRAIGGDVHDADLVLPLLDKSCIELNERGHVSSGLADQVNALRIRKAFLFVTKNSNGTRMFRGIKPASGIPKRRNDSDERNSQ